jgi:hypothetical protein
MCLFLTLLVGFGASVSSSHATTVLIQLSNAPTSQKIASDFTGLSFEMRDVLADSSGKHFFNDSNKLLIATFQTLGIKSLRVGGNTADDPKIPVPNEADVDALFAFAKAAGVKVIYTLRLNEGNRESATRMADYIFRNYKDQLACFAIGNEPNVFSKEYAPYLVEWKKYAAEITAATNSPGAKFCGPSTSPGHESWAADFATELASTGWLAFIAQHDYPGGDARRATNVVAARDKILSPAMDEHYAKFSANFVPAILSNGLHYRLEEANSFYDGGAENVSDTFASALWALDYQWWWTEHGASGINFHTGDKVAARDPNKRCGYAVFWTAPGGYNIHPIGYALKMFSLGAKGNLISTKIENSENLNIVAYAASPSASQTCVTLINREHGENARNANVILNSKMKNSRARAMFLTAPDGNVAAKTGVALGGAEIQDNAKWNGTGTALGKSADGIFNLKLAEASAVLIEIRAKR